MGMKPRAKPAPEESTYTCGSCNHRWKGESTVRGKDKFTIHAHGEACPKCGSADVTEKFPDGATLEPFKPRHLERRRR